MKVVILAGGLGTRLAEETDVRPKPMVEIGGRPILWHIMMHYSYYGFNEFVIALGYKGEVIKKYMVDYCSLNSDLTVDIQTGQVVMRGGPKPDWKVHLVDTGLKTMTGGRVKRLASYIGNEPFMLTYGDGVSDVDLPKLLDFHRAHGKLATLTAVRPVARYGQLDIEDGVVTEFAEKPQTKEGWINGGFFVLQPEVLSYIEGDDTYWEKAPLERLAAENQLRAYKHYDFWQCMDTLRDKQNLEAMWQAGDAPWRIWDRQPASLADGQLVTV